MVIEITRRYRINVGTSVKGVKTYDCTVEATCTDTGESITDLQNAILAESDQLVGQLDKRYPANKEGS